MLDVSSVVIAILQAAAGAITTHLLNKKGKEPIDIGVLVDEAAKELKEKNKELEISMKEIAQSLQSLQELLKGFPEFDVKRDNIVYYKPKRGSNLGDILYRLDEEIESLRKPAKPTTQFDQGNISYEQPQHKSSANLPPILEGLDEEIANLRSKHLKSNRTSDRSSDR